MQCVCSQAEVRNTRSRGPSLNGLQYRLACAEEANLWHDVAEENISTCGHTEANNSGTLLDHHAVNLIALNPRAEGLRSLVFQPRIKPRSIASMIFCAAHFDGGSNCTTCSLDVLWFCRTYAEGNVMANIWRFSGARASDAAAS